MAVDALLALVLAFLSTSAALLQAVGGTVRVERLLADIHQRLVEIRDQR